MFSPSLPLQGHSQINRSVALRCRVGTYMGISYLSRRRRARFGHRRSHTLCSFAISKISLSVFHKSKTEKKKIQNFNFFVFKCIIKHLKVSSEKLFQKLRYCIKLNILIKFFSHLVLFSSFTYHYSVLPSLQSI